MTTTYSTFMQSQMAGAGWDWAGRTMGLVLLTQAAAVGPSTPNGTTALLASLGWQEVSTAACPTYVRTAQAVTQTPAAPVTAGNTITVVYGADFSPIPVGAGDEPVYVAAGLWYIVGTVAGVVNPWVFISDDMFVVVRPKTGRAEALTPAVRAAISRIDKEQLVGVTNVMTLEDIAWAATGRHRFRAVMVVAFAALALSTSPRAVAARRGKKVSEILGRRDATAEARE
jgi:hypothetical protein